MAHTPLHETAVRLAKDFLGTEAQLLDVLMRMSITRDYLDHGCSSLFVYITDILHLSRAQAYYFCKVAEKSKEVPELKVAVDSGLLSLSQARRIAPVLTAANATEWIDKAAVLKQPALELAVAQQNPQRRIRETLKPVAAQLCELRCGVTPEFMGEFALIRDLVSQKLGGPASMADALDAMREAFLDKHSPVRKAERAALRKTVSSRKQLRSTGARIPLSASTKHAVALRDRGRCCYRSAHGVLCNQSRWTEIHHRVPVSEGGGNTVDNLMTLCASHHRHWHEKRSALPEARLA